MGSIPIPGTYLKPTTGYEEYLHKVKRNAPTTIHDKVRLIKRLQKKVNLWDVSEVETYLLDAKLSNGHKNTIAYAYQDWCRMNGFEYAPKLYKREEKLPYIPKENDIDQLISGCGIRLACFLQLIKESGCRPREAWMLKVSDFDIPQQRCYINTPAKGSNPRLFKMSSKLTRARGFGILFSIIKLFITYNWKNSTPLHRYAISSGPLFLFIILTFLQESDKSRTDNTAGMSLIGIIALIGLTLLWLKLKQSCAESTTVI